MSTGQREDLAEPWHRKSGSFEAVDQFVASCSVELHERRTDDGPLRLSREMSDQGFQSRNHWVRHDLVTDVVQVLLQLSGVFRLPFSVELMNCRRIYIGRGRYAASAATLHRLQQEALAATENPEVVPLSFQHTLRVIPVTRTVFDADDRLRVGFDKALNEIKADAHLCASARKIRLPLISPPRRPRNKQ